MMGKLLRWLFGRQYQFGADFYTHESGWKHFSGLFRWGGVFNKPLEVQVCVGAHMVYLAPIVGDVRWNFLRVSEFNGYMDSEEVSCPDVTRWINGFAPKCDLGDPEFKMFEKDMK